MSSIDQIKLLISLAQIDGSLEEKEKTFIKKVGKAGGIEDRDMEYLFTQRHPLVIPAELTKEERFDYLYMLVQLMKIDDKMMREELLFCSTIAASLNYNRALVLDLIMHTNDKRPDAEQREMLLEIASRHYENGN